MKILKDEKERSFDELTSLADETLAFYRDLMPHIDWPELNARLADLIGEQESLLSELGSARRRNDDELPQAGDPERAQLLALITGIQVAVSPSHGREQVTGALIKANQDLNHAIEQTLQCELTEDEERMLLAFRKSCEAFEASLEAA